MRLATPILAQVLRFLAGAGAPAPVGIESGVGAPRKASAYAAPQEASQAGAEHEEDVKKEAAPHQESW